MKEDAAPASAAADRRSMRRVALTALAGTSIEWYDFFLYATAAALVFPAVFFPESSAVGGLVMSFLSFAAGFVARPVGGILFAHYGDRAGRKRALVVALVLMGAASTLIGLLPGHAVIGAAAPALLYLLRFCQGLAIGGQWGGAMLLVTESAPADRRGWYGAYAQAGAPVGVILANLAFIAVSFAVSEEFFLNWGWRIPFLASVALIGVSMYVQLHIEDSRAFRELEEARRAKREREGPRPVIIRRSPVIEALARYPKTIALAAGAFLSIQVSFYILIAFVFAYGGSVEGVSRDTMLAAVLLASALQIPVQFAAAAWSDRRGRRGVFMLGAVLTGVWAFALFPLIDAGGFASILLGVTGGMCFVGLMYGPQAAFYAELFSTEVRYSGASLGYQIGAILGGAFAPVLATVLWTGYGAVWVSAYMAAASAATLVCVGLLTETYRASLGATD